MEPTNARLSMLALRFERDPSESASLKRARYTFFVQPEHLGCELGTVAGPFRFLAA